MDKTPKRGNKQLKTKKKQTLKVVYITNPIKFTATASEFRALVQELTGRDSDSSRFAAADAEVKAEGNVHAAVEEQVAQTDYSLQKGSDPWAFGPYDEQGDGLYSPDNFQGLASSNMWHHQDANLDVFKRLDAM